MKSLFFLLLAILYFRGCKHLTLRSPVDCVKEWGPCIERECSCSSKEPKYFRRQFISVKARNGGKACGLLATEYGCNPYAIDCIKQWGPCKKNYFWGRSRRERIVKPAMKGGKCNLKTDFETCKVVNCVKIWTSCVGSGRNSSRQEMIKAKPRNGGKSCGSLKTEYGCNPNPIDCEKEWSECIGKGVDSYKVERITTPAKYGGKECEPLRRITACKPVDCVKIWTPCNGTGPRSSRHEEITVKPQNGGRDCGILKSEYGCNPNPIDCEKEWSECNGTGVDSYQVERITTPAKYGGNECEPLRRITGCNDGPVDCKKKWGPCIQTAFGFSYRREQIVESAKNGGKCEVKNDFKTCPSKKVDCVKVWTSCSGIGPTSFRQQMIEKNPQNGGKPCGVLETEFGCNPRENKHDIDDTKGKAVATLFMRNFYLPSKAFRRTLRTTSGPTRDLPVSEIMFTHSTKYTTQSTPIYTTTSTTTLGSSSTGKNMELSTENDDDCPVAKFGNIILGLGCKLENLLKNTVGQPEVAEWIKSFQGDERVRGRTRRSVPPEEELFNITQRRDVTFLLDSSGSVGPFHFEVLKKIAIAIVEGLCEAIALNRDRTRISMATFNARQIVNFPFTTTSSVQLARKNIEDVQFDYKYAHRSCIKDALHFLVETVYSSDNGARDPFVAEGDVVIMTDGCANCDYSKDNQELLRAAVRLRANKINLYVIGIGIDENCQQILKVLASGGRCFHFFYLDDWDVDVEDYLYRLQNPTDRNGCNDEWEDQEESCS